MNLKLWPSFGVFSWGVVRVMPETASVIVAVSAEDPTLVGRVGPSLLHAAIATSRAQTLRYKTNFSFMCSYAAKKFRSKGVLLPRKGWETCRRPRGRLENTDL